MTVLLSALTRLSQLGTRLELFLRGHEVWRDVFGNRYYRSRRKPLPGRGEQRWVMYPGEPEASLVPPEGRLWLQGTLDQPLRATSPFLKRWQRSHRPQPDRPENAWFPPGALQAEGRRASATGDYHAWNPATAIRRSD